MNEWMNIRFLVYKLIPFASQIFILNPGLKQSSDFVESSNTNQRMANPILDKFSVPALTPTATMIGRLSHKHHHSLTEMTHQVSQMSEWPQWCQKNKDKGTPD